MSLYNDTQDILRSLAVTAADAPQGLIARTPIDGSRIGGVVLDTPVNIQNKVAQAHS
jgi:hypothetical protein